MAGTHFSSRSRFNRANLVFDPHGGHPPERAQVAQVSANFLTVLQVSPQFGRDFTPEEDAPGGPKVAMLTDGLCRPRFAADSRVLGQRIKVDGVSREIVGVLPPGIDFPHACLIVILLTFASLLACWLPARRAMTVDPLTALRNE